MNLVAHNGDSYVQQVSITVMYYVHDVHINTRVLLYCMPLPMAKNLTFLFSDYDFFILKVQTEVLLEDFHDQGIQQAVSTSGENISSTTVV